MLDADAVINNSSQKVGRSNAYPDPTPKKWVTLPPTKPPTLYHRYGQDLSYKYFLHCCVVIGKITTDKTHRAVTRR